MDIKKMTKKAQREYYNSQRGSWLGVNPVTKKGKGTADYKRRKAELKGV